MKKKTDSRIAESGFIRRFAAGRLRQQRRIAVKVTLNEVAHSVFYAPQYVALEKGLLC